MLSYILDREIQNSMANWMGLMELQCQLYETLVSVAKLSYLQPGFELQHYQSFDFYLKFWFFMQDGKFLNHFPEDSCKKNIPATQTGLL